ncbi:MAG: FliO/MopB family protein [Desulfobulbaceae bacterium]|nr:FliO/MopB family protein [Candidatus Kapabacteria bacterium]MBS4000617.1 FliO/MopB family protein [Desulfobulbaceae bacterium]
MDGSILNTFITLIVAVAILGVLLLFVKRYASKFKSNLSPIDLKVLSKVSLQPKNHLFVVQAGTRVLLLGVTDKSITPIADLTGKIDKNTEASAVNQIKKQVRDSRNQTEPDDDLSFKAFIRNVLKKQSN